MKPVVVVRHVPEEALGKLETSFVKAAAAWHVIDAWTDEFNQLDRQGWNPREASGLVVMGGPMNANETERYPHLAVELRWLREALAAGMPTLGICLGSQLLAKAAGAEVYQNPCKEIGWYGIELTHAALDDPLFSGAPSSQTVFQWHGDTFSLPRGAVLLAKGATCTNQAIRVGPRAYGVQFHPEMTEAMVKDWLNEPSLAENWEKLAPIDPREIGRRADDEIAGSSPFVEQIFIRFAQLCRGAAVASA